jgi:D-xylose 1-dehydrogenase (NADP+, D-xylono-1,5-lactone-forming)
MYGKKLRWGIVSTALIGSHAVIPAIQASCNGEVVAVASRDVGKAKAFAKKLGIPRAIGSYDALLEDADIDAIYNPLPNGLHHAWSIKAAEKGLHVLCEKPLALNAAECEQMHRAADANGVKLMEAFMYRFHPQTEKVIEMVREGVLGKLRMMHAVFSFDLDRPDDIRWDSDLGGGALMDLGCYCVNVIRTMADQEPVEVQAFARWAPGGVDEQLAGTLRFDSGALAQFDCAFNMEGRQAFEITGDNTTLKLRAPFTPGEGETTIYEQRGRKEMVAHTIKGANQYQLMVEHFADCVLNDHPLRYSAAEAAANMRAMDAVYLSARSGGRPVQL